MTVDGLSSEMSYMFPCLTLATEELCLTNGQLGKNWKDGALLCRGNEESEGRSEKAQQ